MEIIIFTAVFGLVFFAVLAVYGALSHRDQYLNRMESIMEQYGDTKKQKFNLRTYINTLFNRMSGVFAAQSYAEKIQVDLIAAGIPLKGEEYLTIYTGIILILPILTYFSASNLIFAIVALFLGIYVPRIYIKKKIEKRLLILNNQLGDALVIMSNALRAGFGFQQAMDGVRKEMPPPISNEFSWALAEMNLGFSLEESLNNLSKRVKSDDLDMVVTGIIIQRQVGGNLALILENISETIRDRARIKKEINVMTAQGKLSGVIIGIIPLVLVAVMMAISPDYFADMIHEKIGVIILGTGLVMELLGFVIIKKITDIDY